MADTPGGARCEITGNFNFGLRRLDTSVIRTFTPASHVLTDNAASDAPNSTRGMTRVRRTRP